MEGNTMSIKLKSGICAGALLAGVAVAQPVHAEGVLNGETLRVIGLGDPVFQAMQKMTAEIEKMGGGKFQLDIKGFDVLHQQVLLNSQAAVSAYDLIPVDLPQFGEYTASH